MPKLVQCIKFAEQLAGRGSERTRAPRMALQGDERKAVQHLYEQAMQTRLDLSVFD